MSTIKICVNWHDISQCFRVAPASSVWGERLLASRNSGISTSDSAVMEPSPNIWVGVQCVLCHVHLLSTHPELRMCIPRTKQTNKQKQKATCKKAHSSQGEVLVWVLYFIIAMIIIFKVVHIYYSLLCARHYVKHLTLISIKWSQESFKISSVVISLYIKG